jgi:4-alpha-glucanotransferase
VTDAWGITNGFHDVDGAWHPTSDETRARLRAAMGDPVDGPPLWFVEHGTWHRLWNPCRLELEHGDVWGPLDELPGTAPIGYHRLIPVDGGPVTTVVIHPARCQPLPRLAGVAVQLYALWSDRSWGIGDLRDLRDLADRCRAEGLGAMLLSPLHQPAPTLPQQASPYYPSSRRATNPLHLAIDAPVPDRLRCDPSSFIDRDEVWIAKRSLLEARFDAVDEAEWPEPDAIAWWNAWADQLGADWTTWPDPRPEPDDEVRWAAAFHAWLQDEFDRQLAEVAATGITLIGDLAVGFSPAGADASEWRDLLVLDHRIGAPPDPFNAAGQEWGLPPFAPWKLRAVHYRPFIETVRASLRGVHGLRIDHVMGLFRQYWVPVGGSPADGAYVRFPAEELLAIICLEAERAGAFVIGEDLGTVEPAVREMLAERGIAGTKVVLFEDTRPADWPEKALATVTTHDLPTIRGALDPSTEPEMRDRVAALGPDAPAIHQQLLASPSAIRLMTTDDLCGAEHQPNQPGTEVATNWSRRLLHPASAIPLPVRADAAEASA